MLYRDIRIKYRHWQRWVTAEMHSQPGPANDNWRYSIGNKGSWRYRYNGKDRVVPGRTPNSQREREYRFRDCMQSVKTEVCGSCGTLHPDGASFVSFSCGWRICPRCGKVMSTKRLLWAGLAALATTPAINQTSHGKQTTKDGYNEQFKALEELTDQELAAHLAKIDLDNFWHITINLRRDVDSEADHTVGALRKRAEILKDCWRACWDRLKKSHRASHISVETSEGGHVHAHILYYGQLPDIGKLAEYCSDILPGIGTRDSQGQSGYIHAKRLYVKEKKDQLDYARTFAETVKYTVKTPGINNIEWFASSKPMVRVLHPVIAARWEVAVTGFRTCEKYGFFRKINLDDNFDLAKRLIGLMGLDEDDEKEKPEKCKCGGEWKVYQFNLQSYADMCRIQGIKRPFQNESALKEKFNSRGDP